MIENIFQTDQLQSSIAISSGLATGGGGPVVVGLFEFINEHKTKKLISLANGSSIPSFWHDSIVWGLMAAFGWWKKRLLL